jgi:hypothetical protein
MQYPITFSLIACVGAFLLMRQEISSLDRSSINGYNNIIFAMEFAEDEDQVNKILGEGIGRASVAESLKDHTRLDYAFILSYGIFIIALILFIVGRSGILSNLLILLVLVACASDIVENLSLSEILTLTPDGKLSHNTDKNLGILSKATYMKWMSLFIVTGYTLWWKLRYFSMKGKIWSRAHFLLIFFFVVLWIIFVTSSENAFFSKAFQPVIIEKIILIHSLAFILWMIWPLRELWRAFRLIF